MPPRKFEQGPIPHDPEQMENGRETEEALETIPDADAVVVFGEWFEVKEGNAVPSLESKMRAIGALELFEKGKVKKIIISGSGHQKDLPTDTSIAEVMKHYLLTHGIPENAILTEGTSVNTSEGIENVLALLDQEDIKKILLETNEYHLPRARQLFENILKKHGLEIELADSVSAEELLKERSPHYEKLVSHFEWPASLKNAPQETLQKGLREFLRRILIYIDRDDKIATFLAAKVRSTKEE
ncbi:MAG TPA: YdcF family protein [Candidatus Paceibacterota bacterium]|jgi:uncharacterized SAM-binding protein YcdF (DUF218 family)|nr:YdcF family protein [Candidatus Paceibacterota bacterium]